MTGKGDKKNKNKKYGRHQKWCQAYKMAGTRERNKKKRLIRTYRRQPNNAALGRTLEKLGVNLTSLQ